MDIENHFRIVKKWNNKTEFIADKITITINGYSCNNGKHQIAKPKTANAVFVCDGKRYVVGNDGGIPNVEDWYWGELLPKMQMLSLLMTTELSYGAFRSHI